MDDTRRTFLRMSSLASLAGLASGLESTGPQDAARDHCYAPSGEDDSPRIQALLDGAAVLHGTVRLCASATPFRLSAPLRVPRGASLVGEGPGTRLQAVAPSEAVVTVDAPPPGNRAGHIANLFVDGAGVATVGVRLGRAVQRTIENVDITGCRHAGLALHRAQNNIFLNVNIERNGTDPDPDTAGGIELADGAGNNCFVRCEITLNGGYQVAIRGEGESPGAFTFGPTGNTFLSCVIERATPTTPAALYAAAGRMNLFLRCDFSHDTATLIETAVSTPARPALWRFDSCTFGGRADRTVLLAGRGPWRWVFDSCLIENFRRFSTLGADDDVEVRPTTLVSNVESWSAERDGHTAPVVAPSAEWNGRHLMLGDFHLWVDPQGSLRIKRGRPDHAFDGDPAVRGS